MGSSKDEPTPGKFLNFYQIEDSIGIRIGFNYFLTVIKIKKRLELAKLPGRGICSIH